MIRYRDNLVSTLKLDIDATREQQILQKSTIYHKKNHSAGRYRILNTIFSIMNSPHRRVSTVPCYPERTFQQGEAFSVGVYTAPCGKKQILAAIRSAFELPLLVHESRRVMACRNSCKSLDPQKTPSDDHQCWQLPEPEHAWSLRIMGNLPACRCSMANPTSAIRFGSA